MDCCPCNSAGLRRLWQEARFTLAGPDQDAPRPESGMASASANVDGSREGSSGGYPNGDTTADIINAAAMGETQRGQSHPTASSSSSSSSSAVAVRATAPPTAAVVGASAAPGPGTGRRRGIDYSKWDSLEVSSDDDETNRGRDPGMGLMPDFGRHQSSSSSSSPPAAVASGFAGRCAAILNGDYYREATPNHDRPVYKRIGKFNREEDVVLYFWDDRDGAHLCGWWFGPAVGSNTVWAFCPGNREEPPLKGWREPWFCDVSQKARVALLCDEGAQSRDDPCEELDLTEVKGHLKDVIELLHKRRVQVSCMECGKRLRTAVVLPCGHLVCHAHTDVPSKRYRCPWSIGCQCRQLQFQDVPGGTDAQQHAAQQQQQQQQPQQPTRQGTEQQEQQGGEDLQQGSSVAGPQVDIDLADEFREGMRRELERMLQLQQQLEQEAADRQFYPAPPAVFPFEDSAPPSSMSSPDHTPPPTDAPPPAAPAVPPVIPIPVVAVVTAPSSAQQHVQARERAGSLEGKGYQPCRLLERLLPDDYLEGAAADEGTSPKRSRSMAEILTAVRTPKVLCKALLKYATEQEKANNVAMAAAACLVVRCLYEEFETTVDFTDLKAEVTVVQQTEVQQKLIQDYKTVRARAAAHCASCRGGTNAVRQALRELPLPRKETFADGIDRAGPEAVAALVREKQEDSALRGFAECPICFSLISAPVTTPCGHSFCRRCLARSLDWDGDCPLCRGRLTSYISAHAVSPAIQALLEALWPKEALDRRVTEEAEELEGHTEEGDDWLPTFSPLFTVPTQSCCIHISEPKYKLMVRRAMSSNLRTLGTCPQALLLTGGGGVIELQADAEIVGTELAVSAVHQLADGCLLVEAVGSRRFVVKQVSVRDGYPRTRMEYLDEAPSSQVSKALLEELLAIVSQRLDLRSAMRCLEPEEPEVEQPDARPVEEQLRDRLCGHEASPAKVSQFLWCLVQTWRGPLAAKMKLLSLRTDSERVEELLTLLRQDTTVTLAESVADLSVRIPAQQERTIDIRRTVEALVTQFRAFQQELGRRVDTPPPGSNLTNDNTNTNTNTTSNNNTGNGGPNERPEPVD
mmetsp:Transcript_80556/g.176653  ORF Transcript_80556/g.176653 Transcript_80556/m.176653 type:complete len:1086 (-) Transcript_80556:57-3314(-)|eukprot:CAMPEP_0206468916 /NCGR_PEP_ID=MMETSP0324_2-20121206/29936_1 /ASSEMBLY_ACC=CAM_ASM_000836 /TAXON_ID=2866 /ORGANISM="Crypthecodinium cohnii, Strain Seligo" /LENGTH=1085 /DNA_ID=CAMNT_0053942509 /DNA_START=177 /DNA_END=3434 /DNA_ORIENTATION=+